MTREGHARKYTGPSVGTSRAKSCFVEILARAPTTCLHCGETVPSDAKRFCCAGCEFVFSLLSRSGLDGYYQIRDSKPKAVSPSADPFAYCDDLEFIQALSGDGRTLDFFLEGVDCTACVWLLEKLPELCTDAEQARLRLGTSRLRVRRAPGGSFAKIAQTLDRLGHRPRPVPTETEATRAELAADRKDLVRLGVAAFATGNIMLLAVSLYAGADGVWAEKFRWISAALAVPVLSLSAMPFYRSAWAALRNGRLNIDVPIVLAVVVGAGVSIHGLWSDAETLYFDSLAMLILLLLASRTWLKRLRRTYLDASDVDRQLLAGTILKQDSTGAWKGASSLSLRAGDTLSVPAGQFVPVDGVVIESGIVQNAALTGESTAESRSVGDPVGAGAKVLSQNLVLKAATDFGHSRLSKILREAERDALHKPRWIQFSDRVAQAFVIAVMLIAAATFAAFAATDPSEGARRALALIIVTCPCVFGMAIPLSFSLAIREAARRGIVVKNADLFERLENVKAAIFDKTGTLTEGEMRVTEATGLDDLEAVEAVLALEDGQAHPIARAIREFLSASRLKVPTALDVRPLVEGGIKGRVNGKIWCLVPAMAPNSEEGLFSRVHVLCDGRVRMEILVQDRLKPGARAAVRWFGDNGLTVYILSGDHPSTVALCARQLGLDEKSGTVMARLSPEQKTRIVRRLGPGTLMIGDGANDAPALAAASCGIAVHGAMDVSLKVSDAYVMGKSLDSIRALFEVALRTRRAIRRNLAFSATFNVLAGGLAVAGLMTPLWAAVLMPLSSVSVLVSALAGASSSSSPAEGRR